MPPTVNVCLSIASPLDNPAIRDAKAYFAQNYSSTYGIAPHISFHIAPIPEANFEAARQALEAYLSSLPPFEIRILGVSLDLRNRFLYIQIGLKELYPIHLALVTLLNRYRDGCVREKDAVRVQGGYYTQQEAANIRQYGYARVLDCFNPHITIGNLPADAGVEIHRVKDDLSRRLRNAVHVRQTQQEILAMYHSDAQEQANMKVYWEKTYHLKAA